MVRPRISAVTPNSVAKARLASWMRPLLVQQQQALQHAVEEDFLLGLDLQGRPPLFVLQRFNLAPRGLLRARTGSATKGASAATGQGC